MDRGYVHRLIDQFPNQSLNSVARVLEALRDALSPADPISRGLDEVPLDDEPLTAEDHRAVMEGLKDLREDRTLSHEDVLRQAVLWDAEEAGS